MNLNSTETKETRKFGFIALVFFGCLCILGLWTNKFLPFYLFGALSLLGVGFILAPTFLRPVYVAWLKIAHLLGRAVNIFLLAIAYYLVITPSGLMKRFFGGRPLPVKPDRKASTYWVSRTEPSQPKDRFLKRY